ncbi:MAG: hypothetical protein IKK85_03585 [Clostridia bacterium]|nr:hypothetical protein [Clostridia bacterium]
MNDVKEFLILFILFFAAIMLVFAVFAAVRYLLEKQGKETDALDAAQDYALKIISQVGLLLFTDAEKTFGGGTGALKLSAVMDKLIAKLPPRVVELIDREWLTEQVELALKRAKDKWQSNPALLNEEGADNGG